MGEQIHRVTKSDSATARMAAARENRYKFLAQMLMWMAVATQLYESHISPAESCRTATDEWRYVVCVHTPEGQLATKITEAQRLDYFAHLEMRASDWDGHTHRAKMVRLDALVKSLRATSS